MLIGRSILGEAVIALLYLIPVGWSAARWGQTPGICAAVAAALAFDFFFIPPFHTFTVGNLEGWLVLVIFLVVAIIVVGRIQSGIAKAQASERDAHFMYEISTTLAGLRTQEAVTQALARHLQRYSRLSWLKLPSLPEAPRLPWSPERRQLAWSEASPTGSCQSWPHRVWSEKSVSGREMAGCRKKTACCSKTYPLRLHFLWSAPGWQRQKRDPVPWSQ